jgi:hypothetical protein
LEPAFFEVDGLGELGTSPIILGFERISPASSMEGGGRWRLGISPGPPPPDEGVLVKSRYGNGTGNTTGPNIG